MKKLTIGFFSLCTVLLISCASLQKDVFISPELTETLYNSIKQYELDYAKLDAQNAATGKVAIKSVNDLISQIEFNAQGEHVEPALKARMFAMEGLLYNMTDRRSRAQAYYNSARKLQPGDSYVLCLGAALEASLDLQLTKLEQFITIEDQIPLLYIESSKVYYRKGEYNQAVTYLDKAFVLLEQTNRGEFISLYKDFKDLLWNLYKSSSTANINTNLINQNLTASNIVELTLEYTNLLDFIEDAKELKKPVLQKKLKENGLFSAAIDLNDQNASSEEFLKAKELNRILCARYIWNLYTMNSIKANKTKYSKRFANNPNAKSPVPDVQINNPDIDAVLGTVENELMDLPDGKNFFPNQNVSTLEFILWLQALQ